MKESPYSCKRLGAVGRCEKKQEREEQNRDLSLNICLDASNFAPSEPCSLTKKPN